MSKKGLESEMYEVAPDTYLTKNLARYLRKSGTDPKQFYDKKIKPYTTALANRKYVFLAPSRDGKGSVVLPIFPENITEDCGDLVIKETSNYKVWEKRVDETIADAMSYFA